MGNPSGESFYVNEPELTAAAERARALAAGLRGLKGFDDAEAAALADAHPGWRFASAVQFCSAKWGTNVVGLGDQCDGVGTKLDETVAGYDGVEIPVADSFDVEAV